MIMIRESGMDFGPFNENDIFEIEKSSLMSSMKSKIKSAEFILNKNSYLWIIEAKSSSPRPDNKENFDNFIEEIHEKFANTFLIFNAAKIGRHDASEFPSSFKNINIKEVQYKFFLVIRGHKEEWLYPLQDAMQLVMYRLVKACNIARPAIFVINDTIAREKGLIE